MKLLVKGAELEVRKPTDGELDLSRLQSVVASLVTMSGRLEEFTTNLAAAKEDEIEAVIDRNFDTELAAERLAADVRRRILRFASALDDKAFKNALEELQPIDAITELVSVSAQIFTQCVGTEGVLKN